MSLKYSFLSAVVFGLLVSSSHVSGQTSQSVPLAWDPSPSPNIVSYAVYYGTASRNYPYTTNVGNRLTATVSGLQPGQTYFFAVTARDSIGMESLPSGEISYQVPIATNPPPVVALTSPVDGQAYVPLATINCAASLIGNGHTITKVQFYNGTTLLGEDASAPYTFTWNNVNSGTYSLKARAMYDAGSMVNSTPATVTVATLPPVVTLTSPTNGASYTAPAIVNCSAAVAANGHTITKVQFYTGTTLRGESASAPYNLAWNNVSAGNYNLTARAVYDAGNTIDSTPANISVTTSSLPPPWQTVDVGSVNLPGSASQSNGSYTVTGAGNIAGTADSFRLVYQPLTAAGEIRARLNTVGTNGANGCIGVMIRETLTPGSKYAFMGVAQNLAFRWQRRTSTGGNSSSTTSGSAAPPNAWVRLTRAGNTVSGYKSTDGLNWTKVSSRNISMAQNISVGVVVASGITNALNTSVFDNISVVP